MKQSKRLLSILLVIALMMALTVSAFAKTSSDTIEAPSDAASVFYIKAGAKTFNLTWADVNGKGAYTASSATYTAKVDGEQATQSWTGISLADVLAAAEKEFGLSFADGYKIKAVAADDYVVSFTVADVKDKDNRYMLAADPVSNYDGDTKYENSYVRILRGDLETTSNLSNIRCLIGLEILDENGKALTDGSSASFSDVKAGEWYYSSIGYCVANKLFEGRGDGTFGPMLKMSSAELITVLYRVAGNTTDGSGDYWYSRQLSWAQANSLVATGAYNSAASITREDFITMFYETVKLTGKYDTTVTYAIREALKAATDYASLSAKNLDAIAWAVAVGLIEGTDASSLTINPTGTITRSEVCTMLMRYYEGLNA